jgi:vacuolar-type H+-ATPase subunit I/STV1
MIDQQYKQDNERLQEIIAALMDEATLKTKLEVESLRKIYNANLEKLIDECNFLETDRNNKASQLEKCLRIKKQLEQEIENVNSFPFRLKLIAYGNLFLINFLKLSNENIKNSYKDNAIVEDLHKRLCVIERDKDQALIRLESKENELKKLINLLVLLLYLKSSLSFFIN